MSYTVRYVDNLGNQQAYSVVTDPKKLRETAESISKMPLSHKCCALSYGLGFAGVMVMALTDELVVGGLLTVAGIVGGCASGILYSSNKKKTSLYVEV